MKREKYNGKKIDAVNDVDENEFLPIGEHIDNLTRHIDLVRDACLLLGDRLIRKGEINLGVDLISRGYKHDASKFKGIEFLYLHNGPKICKDLLNASITHHVMTNDHHPEYWQGIQNMPDICLYEMVADCYARSQEFGTDLREWIKNNTFRKYGIESNYKLRKKIMNIVDLLLINYFSDN